MFFERLKKLFKDKDKQFIYAMRCLENIPDAVYWTDENNTRIFYVNEAACRQLKYSREELQGMYIDQFDGSEEYHSFEDYVKLDQKMQKGEITHFQTYFQDRDGNKFPVEMIWADVSTEGDNKIGVSIVRDISERVRFESELKEAYSRLAAELEERKRAEEQLQLANLELERIANSDQLTGTWNRRRFLNDMDTRMDQAQSKDSSIMLMLLDIDHFKTINDHFGHQTGDQVLIEFAGLLRNNIRRMDSLTRWGGEEFLIMAPDLHPQGALDYAERLRKLVEAHAFPVVGAMTVSIGVAALRKDENIDDWIKRVDDALYLAKVDRNKTVLSPFSNLINV